jgi:hypothetical protein
MTKKEVSVTHENWVAKTYGGVRSRSSGASDTDKGDVRVKTLETIFECKATGIPGERSKRSTILTQLEKVSDEAWAEGKRAALCLRLFCPESPLAGVEGWVDLTVRPTRDDAERELRD